MVVVANVAVVVAVVVAGVIFVGHGHGDDHDYDHHRSLRPGAQVRRGMVPLLAAIRAFAALAVGPRINSVHHATPASSHGGAVIPWHNAWVMSLVRRLGIAPLLLAIAGLLGGGEFFGFSCSSIGRF